jgi:hypothetical protein
MLVVSAVLVETCIVCYVAALEIYMYCLLVVEEGFSN